MLLVKNFITQDKAVTAIEYGLIAALITMAIVVGVTAIGTQLASFFAAVPGYLHT